MDKNKNLFTNLENIHSYQALLLFFILAFILRFFSFFPSIIDHDESTYLVIAKEILKGKVLYVDVTDIKSVGVFYIIAGYIKLFGDSIFGFRVFGAFIIALTSFILYTLKLRIGHTKSVGFASGIIYIIFLSVWTQYGVPINTEHFFNLFTAFSVLILFSNKSNYRYLLAGFILGLGFLIKIVVAFDIAAIFLFLIISDIIEKNLRFKKLIWYFLSGICFFIPFGIVSLIYYLNGHFDEFYHINFEAFGNYPRQNNLLKPAVWIIAFFTRFLPLSVFFFWSLFTGHKFKNLIIREKLLGWLWFSFCLIIVLLPSKRFSHYLIQLMLPMSFLAGNIFSRNIKKPAFIQILFTRKLGYSLLGLFILINVFLQKKDYYNKTDCPRLAVEYLAELIEEDDIIFTGNAQHIIYYLLKVSPPTKYVHPSLLLVDEHYETLGIDPNTELLSILKQNPKFIVIKRIMPDPIIVEALENNYTMIHSINECELKIYRHNSE